MFFYRKHPHHRCKSRMSWLILPYMSWAGGRSSPNRPRQKNSGPKPYSSPVIFEATKVPLIVQKPLYVEFCVLITFVSRLLMIIENYIHGCGIMDLNMAWWIIRTVSENKRLVNEGLCPPQKLDTSCLYS